MDAEDFFAAPAYADRGPRRPRAVNPATGKEQSWTRASNYAAELDSPFGLLKRNQRKLIEGLSQRPDLARMLLVGSVIDDKAKQDEIITAAMAVAEADSSANNGTAAHTALVRSWLGEPVPEEFHPLVKSFVRALKDNNLKPKAAEQRVLNLAFDSLGHFDWVFEEADGTEVIGDVKTGRLDAAKRKFSVQLAMYDGADFVLHKDGRVEPTPWKLSHTHAVLVHIDLEHNAVSLYRVDLHIGRHGAALAEQVRRWHKMDPLTPYVPPLQRATSGPVSSAARTVHETDAPLAAAAPALIASPDAAVASSPSGEYDDHPGVTVNEHGQDGVTVNEHPIEQRPDKPYDVDARFAELMTLDKAPLQSILKNKHNWRDDAHNRRWLARAIIALEQGWTVPKDIVKFAAAKDDSETAISVPDKMAVPPDTDRQATRRETALQAIAGAKSVAALAAFHQDWTGRYGEAAWTDELAALARVRTADLDVLAESAVRARIDGATKPEDLANVWNDVTIGGSTPSLWEPFDHHAKSKLQQLREQQPPVAANPFG